jgi:NhaA family Na+:H+ antiporter
LGAVLVLAAFYTEALNLPLLGLAGSFFLLLVGCNAAGLRRPSLYFFGGALVWLAMLGSGVHATLAGILVALTVPARPKREPGWFVHETRSLVDEFEKIETRTDQPVLGRDDQHVLVERVQDTAEKATTPLRRWERFLESPIALFVMPIFALANAGIPVDTQALSALSTDRLALGIVLGLFVGKSLGITSFTWLALRLNLGCLPRNVTMRHIAGVGMLGGMGFTMSIFIAGLGFASNPEALVGAKTAILLASLVAGISGYLWLRLEGQLRDFA